MNPPLDRPRLSRLGRCGLVLAALGLTGVFVVARSIQPDPRGFGTHEQLGLPKCGFLTQMGFLCPTCGMTTSFAWLTRGEVGKALGANPAGCVVAVLCSGSIFWMLASAIRGRPLGTRTIEIPLMMLIVAAAGVSLLAWTIRLGIGRALR